MKSKYFGYCYKIAWNLLENREDVCSEMDGLNFSYTVDEQIEEKELVRVIEKFLLKLREVDRDIFIRRYWYLDSIKEIAKRHGVTEGCVKTNLCRKGME